MEGLKLIGIRTDELTFRLNNVRLGGDKVQLSPNFSRQVRHAVENKARMLVTLTAKIDGTPDRPTPFSVNVTMTGVFDIPDAEDPASVRSAVIAATQLLYPYIRAAVSTVTTAALAAPIVLPVVSGTLFPEDAAAGGLVS